MTKNMLSRLLNQKQKKSWHPKQSMRERTCNSQSRNLQREAKRKTRKLIGTRNLDFEIFKMCVYYFHGAGGLRLNGRITVCLFICFNTNSSLKPVWDGRRHLIRSGTMFAILLPPCCLLAPSAQPTVLVGYRHQETIDLAWKQVEFLYNFHKMIIICVKIYNSNTIIIHCMRILSAWSGAKKPKGWWNRVTKYYHHLPFDLVSPLFHIKCWSLSSNYFTAAARVVCACACVCGRV